MNKVIIIDDELINLDFISILLGKYCPELEIIATATNVEMGIEKVIKLKPDLIFLDIELHNKNGFEILNSIQSQDVKIIIVTAYEKYALKAIKHNVIDYILKPIQIEELIKAVHKFNLIQENHKVVGDFTPSLDCLSIPHKDHVELIPFNEIIFLEANNTYTKITTIHNKTILSSRSLKENENILSKRQFIRIHHSYIINASFVRKYVRSKTGILQMSNGQELPISASKKKDIVRLLNL